MSDEDAIRSALRPIVEDAGGGYMRDGSIMFPAWEPDSDEWDARHAEALLLRFVAMLSGDEPIAQDITATLRELYRERDESDG